MAVKVFINPNYRDKPDNADGGIRRVVEAMVKHLPKFDVEVVHDTDDADVICNHGALHTNIPEIPSISICHGLYWDRFEWPNWALVTNRAVVENMATSVAHTAPSEWVATAISRGMLIDPTVVYHGIDVKDWDSTKEKQPFVLWNKARRDFVSDPRDMNMLAETLPNVQFVSTIGDKAKNVQITGPMPFEQMKHLIETCGIYLATARETFGIGTLEAMACGVPVVGWDWGGQSEIIRHGETGYLASPGNFRELTECVRLAIENQKRIGENARLDVATRWRWEPRIEQYANIIHAVHNRHNIEKRPRVSVIVTCYNLARYLNECLQSVQHQSLRDFECIIVDDCSTDNTQELGKVWDKIENFHYHRTPQNMGLSLARNFGIQRSSGKYVISLDADDMLDEHALEILAGELDKDWGIHIAYGHLDTFTDGDKNRKRNPWPFEKFSWFGQMAHLNQMPYSSMIRREVFERSGGYRERHWRAEDAAFWCRVTSMGFRAKKVTQASTLVYRMRSDSKSNHEPGDGDWTSWYPWRLAGSGKEGMDHIKTYGERIPHVESVPFGAQGKPPNGMAWPVKDHETPFVSVIIPVGPGHERYVIDAVESVFAQTYLNWEVIVVNDTGEEWPNDMTSPIAGAPYAILVNTVGKTGAGFARNYGARFARGNALFWLDADDFMMPSCLERMVNVYRDKGPCVVYSDWLRFDGDHKEPMVYYASNDFQCSATLRRMQHAVTALVPKKEHMEIGGFDTSMIGWEDWDYFIALQERGLCSFRVPVALFVYGFYRGKRREDAFAIRSDLVEYIKKKWIRYYTGEKTMPCGGCGGGRASRATGVSTIQVTQKDAPLPLDGSIVQMEYLGPDVGPLVVRGPSGNKYRVGLDDAHRTFNVLSVDVPALESKIKLGNPMFKKLPVKQPLPAQRPTVPDQNFVGQQIISEADAKEIKEKTQKPEPEIEVEPQPSDDPYGPVGDLSVRGIADVLKSGELTQEVVLQWYNDEKKGAHRKSALVLLEKWLKQNGVKYT